ncbi:MAG: hypothetical protein ABUS54_01235, partial [Actinomycetota bacterium]
MRRPLSLRARLILGVIVLAAAGLVAADVATYTSLSSFMIDQTDRQLDAAHQAVDHGPPGGGPPDRGLRGFAFQIRTASGTILASSTLPEFEGGESIGAPAWPATVRLPANPSNDHGDRIAYSTVKAKSGGGRFRVRVSTEPGEGGYVLLLAEPLRSVDTTLHRLLWIELLVTAAVLAA